MRRKPYKPGLKPGTSLATLTVRWQANKTAPNREFARQITVFVRWRVTRILAINNAVRRKQEREDLTQSGLVGAVQALSTWRPGRGSRPIREFIRQAVDRAIKHAIEDTARIRPIHGPSSSSPEDALTAAIAIRSAAEHLDPTTKKIIRWCLLAPDPIPIGYAAKALGVSKATAERRLAAGAAALTNLLS